MSLHTVGYSQQYVLPASQDAVPEAFRSNRMAKPINCSMQTVNVPALTGDASASGTSVIQVPAGASAGIMCNAYLRFSVKATSSANGAANSTFLFKGATASATALINRVSTYVNSVQVDNIQNADQVYDQLFGHSTSYDWLSHDAKQLMYSGVTFNTDGAASTAVIQVCVPLIGLLGSQQAMPLYLINGQLQIQIDWNSVNRSFYENTANATNLNGFTISSVQLVYDRVQPEQAFIDHVRSQMMGGQKYVFGYTNYQCTTLSTAAGQQSFNYGLNVSSLRGVVANQILSTNLTTLAQSGYSLNNGMSQFVIQLDGRLISSLTLDSVNAPALVFAELQKSQARIFDASITDSVDITAAVLAGAQAAGTFLTKSFAAGQSCQRVNEGLAFSGSPVSVVTLQTTTTAANYTMHIVFISDMQLLVDSSGSVEIVR